MVSLKKSLTKVKKRVGKSIKEIKRERMDKKKFLDKLRAEAKSESRKAFEEEFKRQSVIQAKQKARDKFIPFTTKAGRTIGEIRAEAMKIKAEVKRMGGKTIRTNKPKPIKKKKKKSKSKSKRIQKSQRRPPQGGKNDFLGIGDFDFGLGV